ACRTPIMRAGARRSDIAKASGWSMTKMVVAETFCACRMRRGSSRTDRGHGSIMGRRRLGCRVGDVVAGADLLLHLLQLAGQKVDLAPLRGDGGVEVLDSLI